VLHEFLVSLPEEDYLYLGDTEWFPYGIKSAEELEPRALSLTHFLLERGTKLLVVACNSAAAAAAAAVRAAAGEAGVDLLTVIDPEAEVAAAISDNGRIGVLATPTTVRSGAYHRALQEQGRALEVTEVAGPDLAPIIQHGFPFDEGVINTVRSYCVPLKEAEIDTLILGCTHYPLVAPMLQRMLGRDVRLVTAGHALAAAAQRLLDERDLATAASSEGDYRFLCTGDVASFTELGTRFLQLPLTGRVERVQISDA
jgi:glutamate racemase